MLLAELWERIQHKEFAPNIFFHELKEGLAEAVQAKAYIGVRVDAPLSPRQQTCLDTALMWADRAKEIDAPESEAGRKPYERCVREMAHEIADFCNNYDDCDHEVTPTEYLVLSMAVRIYEALSIS